MFCVLWHFGDWISRTAILSATEKGVLFDLLVFYYTVERAITREECKRIARAYSQEERDAMQYVLQNFFIEDGDLYKNNRCEEEIAKAKENSEKKRSAANARWSKQGSSKDKNSETDVSASGVDMQKQCTRIPDALQTNNHEPLTNNQEKEKKEKKYALVFPSDLSPEVRDEWVAYKKRLCKSCTQRMVEDISEQARIAGMTLEQAMVYQMKKGWKGFEASWVTKTSSSSSSSPAFNPDDSYYDVEPY